MQLKYPCRRTGKFGHWKNDQKHDRILEIGKISLDRPASYVNTFLPKLRNSIKNASEIKHTKPLVAMGFTSALYSSFLVAKVAKPDIADFRNTGPLVDDRAPYSAIGEIEFLTIKNQLIHSPELEPKPETLAAYDTSGVICLRCTIPIRTGWKYGFDATQAGKKSIIGSVEILIKTDNGQHV